MSRHMTIVVFFVIVLMTSRHVTGQAHDVAQLDKKLTSSDIRFQIRTENDYRADGGRSENASDGSIIGGRFINYGEYD
ncbi:hypothetical protein DPMN_032489 [Dreissena polymorpha]|uniref:Uncharacterized protein n=1 Tax=Dreissena polymorpha TaxID=45954 RepID=A0A9D4RI05_DREPO|nr:hypothetical protein DPMN_032489 [Dreissena polymorpha]